MKKIKKMMVGVGILAFVLMFVNVSMAAMSWDTCSVKRIGTSGDSDNLLKVGNCDNSANNDKWLQLVKQQDTSMATLLTAISLGKKVKLYADFDAGTTTGSAYGPVETIYMDN